MPTIQTLLRKLGWSQKQGKWTNPEGHNRPLTITQAKNAAARDLGSKNYDSLKKEGKLAKAKKAISEGYQYTKGKFKKPRGKAKSLDDVLKEVQKKEAKAKRAYAKDTGYKSPEEKKKLSNFFRTKKASYWKDVLLENQPDIKAENPVEYARYQRELYNMMNGTAKQKQAALNYILIYNGYRTGNEPWPAGQTPRRK